MKPSKQDLINQYRENTIIEVVQALAKSQAGSHIAFKGDTALKLFYDLPRYSEDIDYDSLGNISPQVLMNIIKAVVTKKRWEITDDVVKYNTILLELRFAGPERNFRVKIEISTREKELNTTILSLRGVPVQTLEPTFLMTEKLITFIDRQAGRDIFDAWFILNNAYRLDKEMILKTYGDEVTFYSEILKVIKKVDIKKILRDTGKLLSLDHRNWIKMSFLSDFEKLVGIKRNALDGS
jgi:predicted nucleotidyltransferase component of viral defense system